MRFWATCLLGLLLLSALSNGRPARAANRRKPGKRNYNTQPKPTSNDIADPVSTQYAPEPKHSLYEPFDECLLHWSYGGHAVFTNKLVRLTPSAADKRGLLINNSPLNAEDFEVEIELKVHGSSHFGGEGLGIWFIHPDTKTQLQASQYHNGGPIFGMNDDMRGLGVIVDVYDNDLSRNNPAVFVLANKDGGKMKLNYDLDFRDDMVLRLPDVVPGHTAINGGAVYRAHRCVAELRNIQNSGKLLVKVLQGILHVYVNTNPKRALAYKFCLAVELDDLSLYGHFLALSAATGQVADSHDVLAVTTRYLDASDVPFDDSLLEHFADVSTTHRFLPDSWARLCLLLMLAALVGCAAHIEWVLFAMKGTEALLICQRLVSPMLASLALQLAATVLLWLEEHVVWGCVHLCVLIFHGCLVAQRTHLLDPQRLMHGTVSLTLFKLGTFPAHWDIHAKTFLYVSTFLWTALYVKM
jgi:hypothetical protein